MNRIVDEMKAILEGRADDVLMHYGIKRRSGRYPWGSGEDPYQHGSRDFLGRIEELKKNGWTETPENIQKEFGLTTTKYRTEKALATNERKMLKIAKAKSLAADGLGATEIGRQMGEKESTVRGWLKYEQEKKLSTAQETANFLKERLLEEQKNGKIGIDVGVGAEREITVSGITGISKEKMQQALYLLEREGYPTYLGGVPNVTNKGKQLNQKVLCVPGTQHKEIYEFDKIGTVKDYVSRDNGETISLKKKMHYPESMDSKRLEICYKEDGGIEKDGIVELRRGVEDLSLGGKRYSQVRILVDGTHYIKGMAVYADDLPDGIDVRFNTNKKKGTPLTDVLKPIKDDPDNPFGSAIKDPDDGGQYWYTDKNGKERLGLINKRADEGDWSDWKDALPSQFLAKQSKHMAQKQLDLAKADKYAEYDEICSIPNPTLKKHLLQKFSDECDSAAVHLQAAALPGQKYHVIVPINSLKDNEVYAPNYKDGTKLALIRYPHEGIFQIPVLTVNNKNALGRKVLGTDVVDAVGINHKIAEQLSGADFDGDTVMCIPTHDKGGKVKIAHKNGLEGLKDFDSKIYSCDSKVVDEDGTTHYFRNGKEYRIMTKKGTQKQMGVISNLIMDMTLAGADDDELAAATRHSMVVIDAHKHKLDYKQSELDNNIPSLHKKYQGKTTGGAATIISRAKGEYSVDKRQGTPKINMKGSKDYDPTRPEGAYLYKTADDATYTYPKINKRTGEVTIITKTRQQQSTKMAEVDNAYDLVSEARHPMELIYADYANSMKALGNQARKEMMTTGNLVYDKAAAKTYSKEVDSLMSKLNTALLNATKERAAHRLANAEVKAKKEAGLIEDKSDEKKANQRALSKYRVEVGGVSRKDRNITITDREWEAIQAGAISNSKLKDILNNTDIKDLRERATPRSKTTLSDAKVSKAKAMQASNYTLSEIAEALGVSSSTVSKYLKGVK